VTVQAGETREITFAPPLGFPYKDTFVHVLKTRSHRGGVVSGQSGDGRLLGAFIQITLEANPRPPH
jgi:hypothetical protein